MESEAPGWGYELTLLTPDADEPPRWPFRLLLGLAQRAGAPRARTAHGPPSNAQICVMRLSVTS